MRFNKIFLIIFLMTAISSTTMAFAGEDIGNSAKNAGTDISNYATKVGRWGARQGRKVVGKDTATKDQADRDADAKGDVDAEVTKSKHRNPDTDSN